MTTIFNQDYCVIYLRVIQGCNLNCSHCFTLGNTDKVKLTPIEYIDQFLMSIYKNVNPREGVIYLHGGETFLAPLDYLEKIVSIVRKYFPSKSFVVLPQTNLVYKLSSGWFQFVKEHCRGNVGVSWDADIRFGSISINKKEKQESLFRNNLKKLLDEEISVHVAITAQKHLLKYNPLDVVGMFNGVKSIDFELLTQFDEKTINLKPNNKEWADWLDVLVNHYQNNNVSWCLPQIDLFVSSIAKGKIYNCKCNCCDKRTFTLNPNGSIGLCPDKTYITPIGTVTDMVDDWSGFEQRALDAIIAKIDELDNLHCYECEHYDVCGGNCEAALFDDTDECPLSKKVISRVRANSDLFIKLYNDKAKLNLPELNKNDKSN